MRGAAWCARRDICGGKSPVRHRGEELFMNGLRAAFQKLKSEALPHSAARALFEFYIVQAH